MRAPHSRCLTGTEPSVAINQPWGALPTPGRKNARQWPGAGALSLRTPAQSQAKHAPKLFQVRCCGALEPGHGSQYSPRPRLSGEKKSPDLKPDQKANLPRPWTVSKRIEFKPNPLSIDCFATAEREFFCFLSALAQLLLSAIKLTEWMTFTAIKKGATPERPFEKTSDHLTLGATE